MGAIVFWGILRFALVIIASWLLYAYVPEHNDWWMMFFIAVVVVVLYPSSLAWKKHAATIAPDNQNPLCASCKHLAVREALCKITDEHVTKEYTPCEGLRWEPNS